MADTVSEIASQCDLFLCVECGKCVAACPMTEIFKDFSYEISPRGMIEKTLMEFDVLTDIGIWFCLTCDVCTEICPAGVRYRDFVEGVRQLALGRASPSTASSVSVVADSFYPGTLWNTSMSSWKTGLSPTNTSLSAPAAGSTISGGR